MYIQGGHKKMANKKIWIKSEESISQEMKDVIINEKFDVEYVEEELESQVSNMGRKRMINIPAKDGRFQRGNGVRLLKMDGSGPNKCKRKRNI